IGSKAGLRRNIGGAGGGSARVLVHNSQRVVIPAIIVTAAELHPLCRTRERKSVVDVVAGRAEVRLIINIPSAKVPSASLTEGNIEFELTEPQAERVRRKRQKPAQVHNFQVRTPPTAVALVAHHH